MVIEDMDKCTKSPTGEHVWNYTPRPDNCRLGTCRYCEQQRVFEGAMATHTAAILAPALVKPETMAKAVEIAEKSLEREEQPPLKSGAIAESYHADVLRRLVAGDRVVDIAKDIGYAPSAVYTFKYKNARAIKWAQKGLEEKPLEPKRWSSLKGNQNWKGSQKKAPKPQPIEPKKKPTQAYNTSSGNIMSQMARLGRGEIRTHAAGPVITRYKEMLEETLRVKQSEVKELKAKISVADEALRELDVIQQGEKAVVDKVLAAVR